MSLLVNNRRASVRPYVLVFAVVFLGLLLGTPRGAAAASGAPSIDVFPLMVRVSPDGTLRYKIQIDNDVTGSANL